MSDNLFLITTETTPETTQNGVHKSSVDTPHEMRDTLYKKFKERIIHNPALDRTLVSYQANKQIPFYSWFKYREGFSKQLVKYILQELRPKAGELLDPFAGAGSALFAASELGWRTQGIELLPVGVYAMKARVVAERVDVTEFSQVVDKVLALNFADYYDEKHSFHHVAITNGAFPPEQERELIGYISFCHSKLQHEDIRSLLLFASFSVLEEISYTRKDGQYLRWDARSGRSQGMKPFNKGTIYTFREVIENKLRQIVADLKSEPIQHNLFEIINPELQRDFILEPHVHEGTCLEILPTMEHDSLDFVLTSPPYANRYDYTRTYALELVYLGCTDERIKKLRQTMLSCTVENKDKRIQLEKYYANLNRSDDFEQIQTVFQQQSALQEVLKILDGLRDAKELNNPGIARLVRNYFYEMCFVIFELSRILRPGGIVAMVNDNVRYAGEEVPVDLILSDMAESFGMTARHIWTLGRGKGNSSQQMGNHGRTELRKCVYVWEKL